MLLQKTGVFSHWIEILTVVAFRKRFESMIFRNYIQFAFQRYIVVAISSKIQVSRFFLQKSLLWNMAYSRFLNVVIFISQFFMFDYWLQYHPQKWSFLAGLKTGWEWRNAHNPKIAQSQVSESAHFQRIFGTKNIPDSIFNKWSSCSFAIYWYVVNYISSE